VLNQRFSMPSPAPSPGRRAVPAERCRAVIEADVVALEQAAFPSIGQKLTPPALANAPIRCRGQRGEQHVLSKATVYRVLYQRTTAAVRPLARLEAGWPRPP